MRRQGAHALLEPARQLVDILALRAHTLLLTPRRQRRLQTGNLPHGETQPCTNGLVHPRLSVGEFGADRLTIRDDALRSRRRGRRALIRGEESDQTATVRDVPTAPSMDLPGRRKSPGTTARSRTVDGHSIGSKGLLDEYNSVRARTGGRGNVSADQLQQVLRRHEAAIKKKTGAREVRFRVVDEGGKPKIKAIPVK